MGRLSTKDARVRYAVFGIMFGFAFPIISTLVDAYVRDLGFSLASLIEVQRTQPLHWIIDTAPLFLGLFSCLAGIKQHEVVTMNEGLEHKVRERTEMLHNQNDQLRSVRDELEESFQRISQSINYAQRIQDAIISNTQELKTNFPDSFVMFKPRDVVSGDFPLYLKKDNYDFFAAVDCTGHGVPGAFMSLIGYFLLNRIIKERGLVDTDQILNELHKEVVSVLNQEVETDVHDGMDLAICRVDMKTGEVMFSGAGNPIYHVRGEELMEYKGDFWSIGGTQYKKRMPYGAQKFAFKKGDLLALFSDGVTDQFAADGVDKFGFRKIKKHLTHLSEAPVNEIHASFEAEMTEWMGDHRQMDDMLLMCVRL